MFQLFHNTAKGTVTASVVLTLSLLLSRPVSAVPVINENDPVQVQSALLLDMDTDKLLFEQNPRDQIPPASLTKILSLYVALDAIRDGKATLDSPVVISKHAAETSDAHMGIIEGETIPLKELFLGMAVASGNDASMAVAEFIGGSEEKFVELMNQKAQSLGMTDSHFVNPHGLPARDQYTSARDMLLLARAYLHEHPEMLVFHNTHYMRHGQRISWNRNPLLGNFEGGDGLKTGWIKKSGYNIISTAQRDGHRLIAVILGGPDAQTRAAESCRLLEAGFLCKNARITFDAALSGIPATAFQPDMRMTRREALTAWRIYPQHRQQVASRSVRGAHRARHGAVKRRR